MAFWESPERSTRSEAEKGVRELEGIPAGGDPAELFEFVSELGDALVEGGKLEVGGRSLGEPLVKPGGRGTEAPEALEERVELANILEDLGFQVRVTVECDVLGLGEELRLAIGERASCGFEALAILNECLGGVPEESASGRGWRLRRRRGGRLLRGI